MTQTYLVNVSSDKRWGFNLDDSAAALAIIELKYLAILRPLLASERPYTFLLILIERRNSTQKPKFSSSLLASPPIKSYSSEIAINISTSLYHTSIRSQTSTAHRFEPSSAFARNPFLITPPSILSIHRPLTLIIYPQRLLLRRHIPSLSHYGTNW